MAAPGIASWSYLQMKTFWKLRRQTVGRSGEIIRKWLDHTKLSVANDPNEATHYCYTVNLDSLKASVYRLKSDPEYVYFGINLGIPPANYKALDSITSSSKSTMIKDLRIELIRFGIEFSGLTHPLRTITLTDNIVFDQNLTRPIFLGKILFMFRAQGLVGELIDAEAKRFEVSLIMSMNQPTTSQST